MSFEVQEQIGMVAQVVQDSCALWPPTLYPVRTPRGVSRCAPGMTNFSLHLLYNYDTGETVNGTWREQKSDLGVLKK